MAAGYLAPVQDFDGAVLSYSTEAIYTLDPPPLAWLAEGVIVRGKLNLLVGREKLGKSILALGLALAIAKGEQSYAGLRTEPGIVVYIDAENGLDETARRIRRLSEMPVPPDHFQYQSVGDDPLKLDNDNALDVLAGVLDAYAPDLIVLDSFRSLWTGDENSPREVARVLDPLRDFLRDRGVAGLLLHHANAQGNLRGSTGIPASVENLCVLERGQDGGRKIKQLPSRFGEVLKRPVRFRIVERGDGPLAPIDLVPLGTDRRELERRSPDAPADQAEAILRLLSDGEPRSGRAIARGLGLHPTHRGVRRDVDRLVKLGALKRDADDRVTIARPVAL
jgi:hypothetical protein